MLTPAPPRPQAAAAPAPSGVALLSRLTAPAQAWPAPPEALITRAVTAAAQVKDPAEAQAALDEILPQLSQYGREERLYIACGTLTEKLRLTDPSMTEFWADLYRMFPGNLTALRMLMRWYRRTKQFDEGLHRLHQFCLDHLTDAAHATRLGLGFLELKAYAEFDELMQHAPVTDALRHHYIQALVEQGRLHTAGQVAQSLDAPERLSPSAARRIDQLQADLSKLEDHSVPDILDVLGKMVDLFAADPPPRRVAPGCTGKVAFYSGQLGIGGAERQSTRLVSLLQEHHDSGAPLAGFRVDHAPMTLVRHVTASSRSDFYLPVLRAAGVKTVVLDAEDDPGMASLEPIPDLIRDLYHLLPADIQVNTRKLVKFFRAAQVDVAYLWHDGGVLTAGLAAVIARVPRIVTSFRGMPPNLRRERLRPHMAALYKAIGQLPWATLTTNSPHTARAYEAWLDLPAGSVEAIPNALRALTDAGQPEDEAIWGDILAASPECTETVLGAFRFDHNKRPGFWVETAARYAAAHPQTRFLIVGRGHELEACRERVAELGMEHRVFLPGPTQAVGFYMYRADVLMQLSRMEGLPNSLMEASYCGLPVLTTPAGGAVDIVRSGETGHVLASAETVEHAEVHHALTQLLSDPQRRAAMGRAAHTHVCQQYDIQRVFEKTLTLFAQ